MSDSENEPSFPPPSPSPATSPGGGDAIISIQTSEPEPETHVEFIRHRLYEQLHAQNDEEDIMFTIPRVPHRLRRGKNDAYEPNIISIGPYHRGNLRLQAMEKKKFLHLSSILSLNSSVPLEAFIEKLKSLEAQVRRCYSDRIKLNSNEFVEMMLLDSCFIIQHLLQSTVDAENLGDLTWIAPLMLYDLLLLENQLPFFLVRSMFDFIYPGEHSSSLIKLAYGFYRLVTHKRIYGEKSKQIYQQRHLFIPNEDKEVPHLLHLYHWFIVSPQIKLSLENSKSKRINFNRLRYFGRNVLWKRGRSYDQTPSKKSEEKEEEAEIMIPNATVLHEAGIKFRKNKGRGILDVTFNGGVLEIPPLFIDDGTVSLFNNLIALEHCYDYYFTGIPQFTAYFKFMDHIINTVSDVALLQKNGIIEHTYGSEKEVALLFNQLTRGATINPNNYLSGLYKEVNKYCKKKRHIWGAIFLRRHCSNPLTILSTIGFLFLLAFTFIQSYFAVFGYFRPPP
eukprot:TRINITY_DN6131_c1_g1_i1.p1 TRINITY_DN6131_c1_g1~~TRINITY_DN6131_c1_g1_i1.p1  ORF type:complete len:506 (-),score=44.26 TRINITY_DN6131_c1_g1_i1:165-1682(-)